jgi:hypothetical protein
MHVINLPFNFSTLAAGKTSSIFLPPAGACMAIDLELTVKVTLVARAGELEKIFFGLNVTRLVYCRVFRLTHFFNSKPS